MPWIRFSDDVVDDARTIHAAKQLGPNGLGRVCAVLLEVHGYCNRHLTDGRIEAMIVRSLKTDRRPADVLFALALPLPADEEGWLRGEPDGAFVIVDYLKAQPSRASVLAYRAKDAARKARDRRARLQDDELRRLLRDLAVQAYRELAPDEQQRVLAGGSLELMERVRRHAVRAALPTSAALVGRAVDDFYARRS